MKEELLKKLLEKYYNGDTSLEEELSLREYFSGDDILSGYEAEKEIFRLYTISAAIAAPDNDLEVRIKNAIDHLDEHPMLRTHKISRYTIMSIAAGLLILTASYFMLKHHSEPKDTFSDPRLAYAETMKILKEVSFKLNTGKEGLKNISKIEKATRSSMGSIGKSTSIVSENLRPLALINKLSYAHHMTSDNKKQK
jgi:hypothetical protein